MHVDPEYYRKDESEEDDVPTYLLYEWALNHIEDYEPDIVEFMDAVRYGRAEEETLSNFRDLILKAEREFEERFFAPSPDESA